MELLLTFAVCLLKMVVVAEGHPPLEVEWPSDEDDMANEETLKQVVMFQAQSNHELTLDTIANSASKENDNSPEGKWKRKEKIRYLLKDKVQNRWIELSRNGTDAGQSRRWYRNGKVKVLIHGFTHRASNTPEQNIENQQIFAIGRAYGNLRRHNVIVVDWTSLSTEPLFNYKEAAASTVYAGQDVAEFLVRLKNLGTISNWNDVHLIGHSLGSHVAGVAGYITNRFTGSKVGRITGLDPAGPLFQKNGKPLKDLRRALDSSDARFVDIIHTNMEDSGNAAIAVETGRLGIEVQSGHADFYPNGGVRQPGCSVATDISKSCSHQRSTIHFQNSIRESYRACPCRGWIDFRLNRCKKCKKPQYMGEACATSASGKYYLYVT